MAGPRSPILLQMRGISKTFPGVHALNDVTFLLRGAEIHALMGENGAGKSTLIKILTGVHRKDRGAMLMHGHLIEPRSTAHAESLGISTVYQEINLVPYLSVAENICLGRERGKWLFNWRAVRQRGKQAMSRLGLQLDVAEPLGSFSIAVQQLVAIARALDVSAKVLILDEPTSSLDANEVQQLFTVMRQVKARGVGIIFVTHFLDQVYEISDRITVLRNGQLVGEYETAHLPRLDLVSRMMGKELAQWDLKEAAPWIPKESERPILELRQAARRRVLEPMDLELHAGQVVGLAGLLGSGRTETARMIFGIDAATAGEARIDGEPVSLRTPRKALRRRIGFCPEDRKTEGIIPNLSVRENIILALQASQGWWKQLKRSKQLELAQQFIEALNIVTPNPEQPVRLLSGGNQQKVILARWLASEPRVLLLDEPTRGIDVGAKLEIEKLMALLTEEGMAILFISSDLEELVRNSHRIAVMRDRKKITELDGTAVNETEVMKAIAGDSGQLGTAGPASSGLLGE